MTHYPGGTPENYTIGGNRVHVSELLDASTTPKKYSGFLDLGNIVDNGFSQEITQLEHFTAKSGLRAKDRQLVTEISPAVSLTLDEPNARNVLYAFRGDTLVDVPAAAATSITGEPLRLVGVETRALKEGWDQSAIVVTDWTGVTTYVLNTDYEVVDFLVTGSGAVIKGIRRITGGAIADGEDVLVDYDYDTIAHKAFNPATKTDREFAVRIFGVSDVGNEFIYRINRATLELEGDFSFNDEDWSSFAMTINLLSDVETNPNSPFGFFEHYGIGSDI